MIATNAELTRNGESFFVSFVIEEGQKYNFGEARISTSLDTLDIIELEEQIKIRLTSKKMLVKNAIIR